MMRKALNERQVEVLKWIADGSPAGVMTDDTHKLSAAALKTRGLVKVTRRDGWHAEITPSGLQYLECGGSPAGDAPVPRASAQRQAARTSDAHSRNRPDPPSDSTQTPTRDPSQHTNAERPTKTTARVGDLIIPDQLRNPHRAVVALRDDKDRLGIKGPARHRALLIAQALITACESDGWTVSPVESRRGDYGRVTWSSTSHFVVDTGECRVGIRFLQDKDRTAHEPTARELADKKRYPILTRIPSYDYSPSDRLRIELDGWSRGGQGKWSDGKRMALASKLPSVVHEIARRCELARERRVERERVELGREARRLLAVERATELLVESHRATVLSQQVADWKYASELREYIDAMASVVELADPRERPSAAEWIEWARRHCERVDPLHRVVGMPDDPEPTAEALRPYLQRLGLR